MTDRKPADFADFTETRLTSRLAYDGVLLKVREDTVRLPDGNNARREYVQHPGAVIIIPLLDDHTVILERQFRYPPARHFIELPAGKIEPGEDTLATAQRELREECGYQARSWRHLATLHPCVGYSNERVELYLARELSEVGRALDDGEFLEVVPMSIAEVWRQVGSGQITDIKVLAGLAWLRHFVN